MKRFKKITACICAAVLLIAMMPSAFAATDEVIATGDGGKGITWTLYADGVLTVSGKGPIVDDVKVEIDDEGLECIEKIDCIAWQLNAVLEERTAGLDAEAAARARFEFVKELVIEEGITKIPSGEFEDIYPRSITLPSTLTEIEYDSVNAMFAEDLVINNRDLNVAGQIIIAAHNSDAKGYGSIDEAIDARVEFDKFCAEINKNTGYVFDLGTAFEIKNGIDNELTEETFLEDFNDYYGTDLTSLDALIDYCIEKINSGFGTNYENIEEIYTVATDEDGEHAEHDPALDERIEEMFEAADIEDSLAQAFIGEEPDDGEIFYKWLTVHAPSGSNAEKAAKTSDLPFVATSGPANSFFGKIKAAWEKIKAFFVRIFFYFKMLLNR